MGWMEAGGVAVHLEISGPRDGRPVLLLHELGGSGASWRDLAERLDGAWCIAVDLPGAGRSEKRRGNRTLEELAAVARAVMMALRPEEKWHLIGSALGSFVALQLAREHPEMVASLSICAVVPTIDERTGTYLRDRVDRIGREGIAAVTEASLGNSLTRMLPLPTEDFRGDYEFSFRCQDPDGYSLLSLALADFVGGAAFLGGISVPALVMAGAQDFIWPPELVSGVADAMPDARFHVFEDGGHFSHVQCPQAFAARVSEFWKELAGC